MCYQAGVGSHGDCTGCQIHHIRFENSAKHGLKNVYSKHKFERTCLGCLSLEIKEERALRFHGLGLISMNRGYLRVFKRSPSGKKFNQRRGNLWVRILRKLDCRFWRFKYCLLPINSRITCR